MLAQRPCRRFDRPPAARAGRPVQRQSHGRQCPRRAERAGQGGPLV